MPRETPPPDLLRSPTGDDRPEDVSSGTRLRIEAYRASLARAEQLDRQGLKRRAAEERERAATIVRGIPPTELQGQTERQRRLASRRFR
jgi:hypothetical protein